MASTREIADWISNYFAANQLRVANALGGPKRETWFSTETFVALNQSARPLPPPDSLLPEFSCWGEEQYTTLLNKVAAQPAGGAVQRKPDVVCYLPKDGADVIYAILELKLVLNDEAPDAELQELRNQLLNARQIAPRAKVLGIVFIAAAPLKTPGTFDRACESLRSSMESQMPDGQGFSWVDGHRVATVFGTVYSGFHYPSMTTSLALGVRELQ